MNVIVNEIIKILDKYIYDHQIIHFEESLKGIHNMGCTDCNRINRFNNTECKKNQTHKKNKCIYEEKK